MKGTEDYTDAKGNDVGTEDDSDEAVPLLNESEFEESDIEYDFDNQSGGEDEDEDVDEDEDGEVTNGREDEEISSEVHDSEDEEEYIDDERDNYGSEYDKEDNDGGEIEMKNDIPTKSRPRFTYSPAEGEDIYGRPLEVPLSNTNGAKYLPPSKRTATSQSLGEIDNNSERVKLVKRSMNGLLNRLTDQSKESIVRSMKSIYDSNPSAIVTHVLKNSVLSICANPTQIMSTLTPLYAAVVAAMHFVEGQDVGASVVETVVLKLHTAIKLARVGDGDKPSDHDLIGDKTAVNLMIFLIYLYNFRVLYHSMIIDILNTMTSKAISEGITDLEMELLSCAIDHCGPSLRADDPNSLRGIISSIGNFSVVDSAHNINSARAVYFMEVVTDLKNSKSRRVQSTYADYVKKYRKWLGGVKSSLGSKSEQCLRIGLVDVLEAETRGRWWKAGASWQGRGTAAVDGKGLVTISEMDKHMSSSSSSGVGTQFSNEDTSLLLLAKKLKMNTDTRRDIFMVIMTSYDINDAFERLTRLDLKGKNDREVIKVLIECCSGEKKYNPFYSELCALLCSQNRQYKTTLQYTFWDMFKGWVSLYHTHCVCSLLCFEHALILITQCWRMYMISPQIQRSLVGQ